MSDEQNQEQDLFAFFHKAGKDPEAEQAFAEELGNAMGNALDYFAHLHNRLGVYCCWSALEEDHYNICIAITDGLVSLLPSVPDEIRQQSAIRYAAELEFASQTFGEDIEKWPEEVMRDLTENKLLVVSFWPSRIRKFKAEFALAISIMLPDWQAAIRVPLEKAIGITEGHGIIQDWPRDIKKMMQLALDFLDKWLLSPVAWETCRDRRIGLFARIFGACIENTLGWSLITVPWPRKYVFSSFWCSGAPELAELPNSPLLNQCREIVGTFLKPGKNASFVMRFNLKATGAGMEVSLHGPVADDAAVYATMGEAARDLPAPVFQATVPEADFSASAESEDIEGHTRLERAAAGLATEVLEFMGIEV